MKKLLIMAAVAMLGVAANAAAFSWTCTAVTDSPAMTAGAGMAVYFMAADTYDGAIAAGGDGIVSYVSENYLYQTATTAVTSRGKVTVNANGSGLGSYSEGDSQSGYLVIFDTANIADATYYAMTEVKGSGTVTSLGNDISIAYGTFTAATTATQGWAEVAPEPTSGLMMLLGMGVLALRRRRA